MLPPLTPLPQLQMFPGLTPESRYLRLKFFVLKSKKKLFHLMAIVKWASASPSSIKSFFENLRAVHARIGRPTHRCSPLPLYRSHLLAPTLTQ